VKQEDRVPGTPFAVTGARYVRARFRHAGSSVGLRLRLWGGGIAGCIFARPIFFNLIERRVRISAGYPIGRKIHISGAKGRCRRSNALKRGGKGILRPGFVRPRPNPGSHKRPAFFLPGAGRTFFVAALRQTVFDFPQFELKTFSALQACPR
jgi:hypothetical protein